MYVRSKSQLAVLLSKLKTFTSPKAKLEQYATDSEVAAAALWNLALLGDIEDKTVADLGCGTGILGIGALALGAKRVHFIEKDKEAVKTLKENIKMIEEMAPSGIADRCSIYEMDIAGFSDPADIVIQNPPFGTKEEHADKEFLEKAFETAPVVCSFHKSTTTKFVEAISKDKGFRITHRWDYEFPLKKTQSFHKKRIERIEVSCYRMQKK